MQNTHDEGGTEGMAGGGGGSGSGNEETAIQAEIPSGRSRGAIALRTHEGARGAERVRERAGKGEGEGGGILAESSFIRFRRALTENNRRRSRRPDSIRGGAVPSFSSSPPRDTGRAFPSLRRDRAPVAARGMHLSPVALCRGIRDTLKRIRKVRRRTTTNGSRKDHARERCTPGPDS